MKQANFHPFKTANNKLVKLEDVFLQANGMAGHKYLVKDLNTKQLSEINMHFQKDTKGIYHQQVDGDTKALPAQVLAHLRKNHIDYSFMSTHHDSHRH